MATGLVERLMRPSQKKRGKSAMRLLEQSVHVLRLAPLDLLPVYYIGSLPFVLGLLYFWSDMSRSADAEGHVAAFALGMALLFGWMKTWQAVFSARVLARLSRQPSPAWPLSRLGTLIASQTLLQATGVVVLPLALLMIIPFGWCFAFYQNVTALSGVEATGVKRLSRESFHQAGLWPYQNHKLLAVLSLFSLIVSINLAIVVYWLPYGVKTIFGYESIFTLNAFSLLNTTFMVTVLGLTYLCVDPLVKTIYALRCFNGFAMISAADIRMDLNSIRAGKWAVPALLIAILLIVSTNGICAEHPEVSAVAPLERRARVRPEILNQSIQRVLKRSEFSWRLPRTRMQASPAESSWLATVLKDIRKRIAAAIKTVWEWLKRLGRWIKGLFGNGDPSSEKPSEAGNWMRSVRGIIALLAALFLCIGGVLLWKIWQRRSGKAVAFAPAAAPLAEPDLDDENIRADELPSDRWIALAQNLLRQGHLRQAMRAFFLATLAQLSERGLITIQNYKSNRDYIRELARRTHTQADLAENFSIQVNRFDRAWYGMHPVMDADVRSYATMQERIMRCVENA